MNKARAGEAGGTVRALNEMDRWVTAKEAGEYLSVELSTLAKWRQRGTGPSFSATLGRDPRYRLSALEDYMMAGVAENTTQARTIRRQNRANRYGG
jgi:hypothetical protein